SNLPENHIWYNNCPRIYPIQLYISDIIFQRPLRFRPFKGIFFCPKQKAFDTFGPTPRFAPNRHHFPTRISKNMDLLTGIKIIDFTRLLPGPVATCLLAQMGAEVIKIESPKRMDYARLNGKQVDNAGILFHQLNHHKTLKTIDYTTPDGRAAIFEMVKNADVLIEQFRPGAMQSWGLGYEPARRVNPAIVYVSITGYGQNGSHATEAGHDVNYLARAGLLSLLKDEKGKPTIPDAQFADVGGAYMAVMATQSALLKKCRTGAGSYVDVSLCDAVLPFMAVPYSFQAGGMDYRKYNIINGKLAVNYAVYECSDGKWISVGALELKFWNQLCDALEKPDWQRQSQRDLLNEVFPRSAVESFFKTRPRDYWVELVEGLDVCLTPVLELEELETCPYHQSKQNFTEFQTPNGAILKGFGMPFKISPE
ncbi:MAG: CoA transferase, partial [Bacteroidetes bacterium]